MSATFGEYFPEVNQFSVKPPSSQLFRAREQGEFRGSHLTNFPFLATEFFSLLTGIIQPNFTVRIFKSVYILLRIQLTGMCFKGAADKYAVVRLTGWNRNNVGPILSLKKKILIFKQKYEKWFWNHQRMVLSVGSLKHFPIVCLHDIWFGILISSCSMMITYTAALYDRCQVG